MKVKYVIGVVESRGDADDTEDALRALLNRGMEDRLNDRKEAERQYMKFTGEVEHPYEEDNGSIVYHLQDISEQLIQEFNHANDQKEEK